MNDSSVFIIAELSANHLNDLDVAVKTVKAIAESGADAVKVQTYRAESVSMNVDNEYFAPIQGGLWDGLRPYDLYKQASMPWEWQPELKAVAESLSIEFFSSPFDIAAVEFLEEMGVSRYKIASFEITDIPLISCVAGKNKPVLISTGVADESDIWLAVETCRKAGNDEITLLKCTSEYPASVSDANLLTIPDLKEKFQVDVGVSDHSMGSLVPTVAVSLGARVVEKHFTLDRDSGGADSAFSMEPAEFADMVQSVRQAEEALGRVNYDVSDNNRLRRRSLFASQNIKKGDVFTLSNVRSVRPGHGLHPKLLQDVLGAIAVKDVAKGMPLTPELISSE